MATNHLEKVPQEMMDHIITLCDKASLLSLRATKKCIFGMTDKIFISRHFKKRTHLYTVLGLFSLTEITASRLGNHIHEIELVSRYMHMGMAEGQHKLGMWNGEGTVIAEGGIGRKTLYKILHDLQHGTCELTVKLSNGDDSMHPYGAGTHMLTALLEAGVMLAEENVPNPIRKLHAHYHQHHSHMQSMGFKFTRQAGLSPTAWDQLKLLNFDMGEDVDEWSTTEWKNFKSFLESAPNLESVTLDCTSDSVGWDSLNSLDALGDTMASCRAKHLELGPCDLYESPLIELLCTHMAQLQSLKLVKVSLPYLPAGDGWGKDSCDGSWNRVLKVVAKKLNLRSVELVDLHKQLFSDSWNSLYTFPFADGEDNRSFSFKGSKAVREGLERLVSSGQYLAKERKV
ncbi:hypothetical protein LTR56_022041 [Elasticomyces elasticus]|nr:hypothetical protein LTR56_022041 [Elasticomyces elasticus]KAK3664961.1 hypothetical protein LTR22_004267 [Elasticomyces elasticus]KAK4929780.1 hypothetical protein LTR49_003738 [Elasticomyces elasticus]KAK5756965.1 hypothetical protein LTS12_012915 [Elasticomyces elasticus]